jgi:hypothetical protein
MEKGNEYNVFLEKQEGSRHHGRYRCRWADNIKVNAKAWNTYIHVIQRRDQWQVLA